MEQNLEEQSKISQKYIKNDQNSEKKGKLPPELEQIFENMSKNVLTKKEN